MAQDRPSTLEYALLGLIGLSPMTGYDIHKLFATTPLAHFSSSPGAIYPALRRLAGRGLLEARLDTTSEARPRRVYSLSLAGEDALEDWLRQPVTREELVRGGGAPVLRFALAEGRLSKSEILSYLEGYGKAVKAYLEELSGYVEQKAKSGGLHERLALDHGVRGYQSELDWIAAAAARIKRAGRHSSRRMGSA